MLVIINNMVINGQYYIYIINNMATLVLLIMIDGYNIDLRLIDNTSGFNIDNRVILTIIDTISYWPLIDNNADNMVDNDDISAVHNDDWSWLTNN